MVSEIFNINFLYGNDNEEETNEIILNHINLLKEFGMFEIMNSKPIDDMEKGIDLNIKWKLSIAKRRRRTTYRSFASEKSGGSFTLRLTGENGGGSEVGKMMNGLYKADVYIFIWSCGSYALIDIEKWIKSGLLERKIIKNKIINNKNKYNKFISFTLSELEKNECIIYFYKKEIPNNNISMFD